MIEMFKALKEEFKENPLEVIKGFTFMSSIFLMYWAAMWIFA